LSLTNTSKRYRGHPLRRQLVERFRPAGHGLGHRRQPLAATLASRSPSTQGAILMIEHE
jgi:hypothetical protein